MKKIVITTFFAFLFLQQTYSQLNFSIQPRVCVNSTVFTAAMNGTSGVLSPTWVITPSIGVSFYSLSITPNFTFASTGNFTVVLFAFIGNTIISTQHTIDVLPLPTLVLNKNPLAVCAGYSSTITAFGASSYSWTGSTFTNVIQQQSISVPHGTYTLTASNNQGCISKDSLIVIPLAPPLLIGFSPTSATTCITSNSPSLSFLNFKPVSLIATGATIYQWFGPDGIISSTGSIVVNPTVATQYTVMGSTSSCSGTAVLNVTVNPQFTIAISPSQQTICVGESINLSAAQIGTPSANPLRYKWQEEDQVTTLNNTTGSTVKAWPTSKRTYSLTVTDTNNCISPPAAAIIEVAPCTNINELNKTDLRIFPNPFENEIFIEGSHSPLILEIRNALGQLILSKEIDAYTQMQKVETSMFSSGVYLFYLRNASSIIQIMKLAKP